MEYVVIIESSETGFEAYVPDLPGCVAVGETREETLSLIREAVEFTSKASGKKASQSHLRAQRSRRSLFELNEPDQRFNIVREGEAPAEPPRAELAQCLRAAAQAACRVAGLQPAFTSFDDCG